jgi:hypothetical protein
MADIESLAILMIEVNAKAAKLNTALATTSLRAKRSNPGSRRKSGLLRFARNDEALSFRHYRPAADSHSPPFLFPRHPAL